MQKLHLDFETRSLLNLPDVGLDNYAKHDSTEVLMLAWAFGNEDVELWEPRLGPMPQRLHEGLISAEVTKVAWNFDFEKDIFQFRLGYDIPQEQWSDPGTHCLYLALPKRLERAAKAMNIDIGLAKHHLVGKGNPKDIFCKPSKTTKTMLKKNPELPPTYFKDWDSHPEKWEEFRQYCLQDVRAERAIELALEDFHSPMTQTEWSLWQLDRRMNERGVWIDQVFVNNGKWYAEEESAQLLAEIKKITGLDNPNSRDQLLGWLQARGYHSDSIDKENIDNALTGKLHLSNKITPEGKKVLELKQRLGGSAYKKFESILDRMGFDGRLRDQFVYHGAHTGRWSGRGVQLQNLFKPNKDVGSLAAKIIPAVRARTLDIKAIVAEHNAEIEAWNIVNPDKKKKPIKTEITTMMAIAGTIRTSFAATPGNKLLIGDLAQIESRVLAAIAGCQAMIDAYAQGHDLYKEFMAWLLKKPVDQIDSDERARGKVVILGCGFGMGVDKFVDYAATFGIALTEAEAKEAVYGFREKYAEISGFWKEIDNAVKKAVKIGCCVYVRGLVVDGRDEKMLRIKLPSGRYLHYLNPQVTVEERWGRMMEGVSYESWDAKGRQIKRLYGGLLTENVVQAVARDLLANGMLLAEQKWKGVIMTIHDEIVVEVKDIPENRHEDLLACMTETPEWAEGMGFILAAEGCETKYYKK